MKENKLEKTNLDSFDAEKVSHPEEKQGATASKEEEDYYAGLYEDLPKEVVDILMQTHPLRSKEQKEETSHRTRRVSAKEVQQVRQKRMEQVSEELEAEAEVIGKHSHAPAEKPSQKLTKRQEGPIEVIVTEKAEKISDTKKQKPSVFSKKKADEEEDMVHLVRRKPERLASVPVTLQAGSGIPDELPLDIEPIHSAREVQQTEGVGRKERRTDKSAEGINKAEEKNVDILPMDFHARAKEEHLDRLYEEFEDGEEEPLVRLEHIDRKRTAILGIACLLLIFMVGRSIVLGNKVKGLELELAKQQDLSQRYEELQLKNLALEEEISGYKGDTQPEGEATNPTDTTQTTQTPQTPPATPPAQTPNPPTTTTPTVTSNATDTYTVVDKDTIWDISKKLYGNGAYYTKILEANGLKETDTVSVGQVLKIPKL